MAMAKASDRCRIALDFEFPRHPVFSLSDIQEFFDGHSFVSEEEGHRGRDNDFFDRDEEEEESPCINGAEESKRFWGSHHDLLKVGDIVQEYLDVDMDSEFD